MRNSSTRPETSDYTFFTGGGSKIAEFTIFYNIAYKNLEKLIYHFENKDENIQKNTKVTKDKLSPSTLGHLAEYMWKAHTNQRNKSGYAVTEADEKLIQKLLEKLNEVRNYHSHIWHSNEVLRFDKDLVDFVNEKFEFALSVSFEEKPSETINYEKLLDKPKFKKFDFFNVINGNHYITREGKIFFLSFFLTTGQMTSFLQRLKGTKRTDMPLFKMKHDIYTYYCHRDGASVMGFHQEESILKQMNDQEKQNILKARQAYKLITYLNDMPDYLNDSNSFPLLLPELDAQEKLIKVTTIQDLLKFIKLHDLLPKCTFSPIKFTPKSDDDGKKKEEIERTGAMLMNYEGIINYQFQINFDTLFSLVLVTLKYGEQYLDQLQTNLENLALQRHKLYNILNKDGVILS